MKREDATILELNGFIMNAGIVGFVKMLEQINAKKETDYEFNEHELLISNAFLKQTDWAQAYIDTTIDVFYSDSVYPQIFRVMDQIEELTHTLTQQPKMTKEEKTELTDLYKILFGAQGYLMSNSFKSGYVIIQDETGLDLKSAVEGVKAEKDFSVKLSKLKELVPLLHHPYVKEVLCLKNIAYRYLNKFWSNKGFLTTKTKVNMKQLLEADFTQSLATFQEEQEALKLKKSKKKGVKQCLECDRLITRKDPTTLSLLNDMADDIKRKASAFWDFNPAGLFLCDLCAFTYILAPLGFVKMGDRMVFINASSSVEALVENNRVLQLEDHTEFNWFQVHRLLISRFVQKHQVQVENIQFITRTLDQDRPQYSFMILDRETLAHIDAVELELEGLAKGYPIKLSKKESLDVYDEVLRNILNHRSQELLLMKLLRLATDESLKSTVSFKLQMLFNIVLKKQQAVCQLNKSKGGLTVTEQELYEATKTAASNGVQTMHAMKEAGRQTQLSSIIYRLINLTQTNNKEDFFATVLQLNNSTKRKLSPDFVRALTNEAYFKVMATAYIMGLQGTAYSKTKKTETDSTTEEE